METDQVQASWIGLTFEYSGLHFTYSGLHFKYSDLHFKYSGLHFEYSGLHFKYLDLHFEKRREIDNCNRGDLVQSQYYADHANYAKVWWIFYPKFRGFSPPENVASTLFFSILKIFPSTLFFSILNNLYYSILFYSILFYSILF